MAKKMAKEITGFVSCTCGTGYFTNRQNRRMSPNFRCKKVAAKMIEFMGKNGSIFYQTIFPKIDSSTLSNKASIYDILSIWKLATDLKIYDPWPIIFEAIGEETVKEICFKFFTNHRELFDFPNLLSSIIEKLDSNCH